MTQSTTLGSLYSGIAGLEVGVLAAFVEAGISARISWQVEIDPFATRVLAHHFPDVERFGDVATVSHPPAVDVLVGGFACQDVSAAGLGKGLGADTRSGFTLLHLLRIIDEIAPPWLIIENVASGAKRWLPRVVQELGDRGYRARAVPLGAVDVGAPHRRGRVFVVGDRAGARCGGGENAGAGGRDEGEGQAAQGRRAAGLREPERAGTLAHGHGHGREGERRGRLLDGEWTALGDHADGRRGGSAGTALPDPQRVQLRDEPGRRRGSRGAGAGEPGDDGAELADAAEPRRARAHGTGEPAGERRASVKPERCGDAGGDGWKAQPRLGRDAHGLPFDVAGHAFPAGRGAEQHTWEPPRAVAGSVKVPDRPAKLRALGNAVVPQCGLVVGRILIAVMRGAA